MLKQIIIYTLIAILGFGLGFGFAYLDKKQSQENAYQEGWDAAKQRLQEAGYLPFVAEEIFWLEGRVERVEQDKITLKIFSFDPLADPDLDIRIVWMDSNTKVYQLKPKEPAEYQKEEAEFFKKMEEQAISPELFKKPIPQTPREPAQLSDIKQGQEIMVVSDADIRDKKQFKAVEVVIQSFL